MKNTFTNLKAARKEANRIEGVVYLLPLQDGYVVVRAKNYNPCAGPIVYQNQKAKEFLARRAARGLRKRRKTLRRLLKVSCPAPICSVQPVELWQ